MPADFLRSCASACAFRTAAGAIFRSMAWTLSGCSAVCTAITCSACVFLPNNLARSARSFTTFRMTGLLSFSFARLPFRRESCMIFLRRALLVRESKTGFPEKLTIPISHLPSWPRSFAAAAADAISFSLKPSSSSIVSTKTAKSFVSAKTFLENCVSSFESSSLSSFRRSRCDSDR